MEERFFQSDVKTKEEVGRELRVNWKDVFDVLIEQAFTSSFWHFRRRYDSFV
jgi:3-phosphoglycerate kinase